MIKTQEVKQQIEELTQQNDMLLNELEQVKRMIIEDRRHGIKNGQGSNSGPSNSGGNSQGNGQSSGDSQCQGQNQNQNQNQQKSQQGQNQDSSNNSVSDLANELLKIKDMVNCLEQKTTQYVSSQSNSSGSLSKEDVVNLVLTLMNGMIDWASEYVEQACQQNGAGNNSNGNSQ